MLQAAVAHHQAGRLSQAAAGYYEILEIRPDYADALHLLGLIAFQDGKNGLALDRVDEAIAIDDSIAMYHANRGRILKAAGRNDAAAEAFADALRRQPGDPATLSDLAGALVDAGDAAAARHFANRAVELAPDMAGAHYNMGLVEAGVGEVRSARAAFEQAIACDDHFTAAHFELARIFHDGNDLERAAGHYRQVLRDDPSMLEAQTNLGNVLRSLYELEEAVRCFQRALELNPDIAAVHGNLGVALQELGDPAGALASYDRALAIDPDDPETRRNRAQVLLQLGHLEEGWPAFEWRWQTKHFAAIRRDWSVPQWGGEVLPDATVLVHAEQGFGDTLQFARYLPLLAEKVGRMIVECPTPVAGLIAALPGVDDVIAAGRPLPAFDAHIPMMSLPGAFATTLADVPADVPYLNVPETAIASWSKRIGGGDRLNVGFVWKGSHNHQRNRWRSPGIHVLGPLIDLPGIQAVSLQKDDEAADLRGAELLATVLPMGQEFRNFTDTAAAIHHLDLVIAPDTAVAHLAGALGKPVWLMLPYVAEWRWLMDRDDSPWYPTMRLFRQTERGSWSNPVERARAALMEWVGRSISSS